MDSALDFVRFVALAALLVVRGDIFEIKLGTILRVLSKFILAVSILSKQNAWHSQHHQNKRFHSKKRGKRKCMCMCVGTGQQ